MEQETNPSVPTKRNLSVILIPIAIIIAGIIIAAGVYLGLTMSAAAAASQVAAAAGTAQQPTVSVNIKDVKTDGEPYIGDADAPVTMAFWSDYQCPYCKAFEVGGVPQITIPAALPDLVKDYVDTGKLRIVFKDFPFLGQDSITAAEYGRSIWKLYPDQYFAWRTAMYTAQDEEDDQGFGDAASIDQLIKAQFPKIDDVKIAADISANKSTYDQEMQADEQEGVSFGIQGTPGFVIGTQLIGGLMPLSTFTSAIDPLLSAASK